MHSAQDGRERRQLPRAVFSADENLTVVARLAGNDSHPKNFKVMNISRGGIGLAINRSDIQGIEAGGQLILDEIKVGIAGETYPCNLPMEVAWMMDHQFLENVGMGCQFSETHPNEIKALVMFINRIFPDRIQ